MRGTADHATLRPFGDGLWIDTAPIRILGMKLTATMAAVRLDGGKLVLFSPLALTPDRGSAVSALGRVAHLYAPNLYHHRYLGEWAAAFPAARVHGPPGLVKKRPDLRIDRVHAAVPEPDFAGVLDEIPIGGFRLQETVLVHRAERTLLVADLVHNVGRPRHGWTALYTRAMGFHDGVALSRMIRWIGFSDRAAARASLDAVLARDFDRLVVGHGMPLATGAREALAGAYAWLPKGPPSR